MPPFRPTARLVRALELPQSYVPQRTLHPHFFSPRPLGVRRCMCDGLPKRTPAPLEEWRNPQPSKWPNRIRLLLLPLIGAMVYSMVGASPPPIYLLPKNHSELIRLCSI